VDNLLSITKMNPEEQIKYYLQRVRDVQVSIVSHQDRKRLAERHLVPSLEALDWIPEEGRLIDIGSGGGFPGIPIAIRRPQLQVTLVESNSRKASFLKRVSRETTLNNLIVLNLRAEYLDETHEKAYDVITVRAVADLVELIEWTDRLLKPGGRWLLWKGRNWKTEADPADYSLKITEERPLSDGSVLLVLERNP
jgi:16S rRNA (guanine527-N7)-methyltransferase